jgi:hypothetical protein
VTPEELRKEAAATEFLARLVSFRPDKAWLTAKAAELRHQADKLEARSWSPGAPRRDPSDPQYGGAPSAARRTRGCESRRPHSTRT